jgi:hypothetical protein
MSLINWLLIQVSNPDYLVMSIYILVDLILLFVSWGLFILLYFISTQTKTSVNNLLKFSSDIPLTKKYLLYIFITTFAIPNRIFINHGLNPYLVGFVITLLFLLTDISPFLIFTFSFLFTFSWRKCCFCFLL